VKNRERLPEQAAQARWAAAAGAVYLLIFGCVLAVCAGVYRSGDDFFYTTFTGHGAAAFLRRHLEHYRLANGRVLVHVAGTLLLGTSLWVWRAANAAAAALGAYLAARVAGARGKDGFFAALGGAAVLLGLDSAITRQSLYWLIGSVNYVWPMVLALGYWLAAERKPAAGWLPVLAFFAGATTEQVGLIAVGVSLLCPLAAALRDRRRPAAVSWLCLLASVLGLATVLLAPGLRNRAAQTASPVSGGLLTLVVYNLKYQGNLLFFSKITRGLQLPLILAGLALCAARLRLGKARGLFWAALALDLAALAVQLWLLARPAAAIAWPVRLLSVAGESAALLLPAGFWFAEGKDHVLLFAWIFGFGAQLAMTLSTVYGPRVLCSLAFCEIVLLARTAVLCRPLPAAQRTLALLAGAAVLALAARTWRGTLLGTWQNAAVYRENLAAVAAFDPASGEPLRQSELPREDCVWVMPYQNDYYDPYYKDTYGLPRDTQIIWEEAGA